MTSRLPNVPRPELLCVVEKRMPEKRLVVVAFVVVEFPLIRRLAFIVEEAFERKPLSKPIVVVVDTP